MPADLPVPTIEQMNIECKAYNEHREELLTYKETDQQTDYKFVQIENKQLKKDKASEI